MHHSRLCTVLIDCKTSDVDQAARFWSEALGRTVDLNHANSRGNYRMLETPADELIVEIQRVDHESRVHIDIETDDIPAEVARLTKVGAKVVSRLRRWVVVEAPTGQRFCVVRVQRPGFPKNANRWDQGDHLRLRLTDREGIRLRGPTLAPPTLAHGSPVGFRTPASGTAREQTHKPD